MSVKLEESSDRLCDNSWYRWAVFLDYVHWLNALTDRQRRDHFMRVAYVEEYIRQGAPRGFQWTGDRHG